MTGILNIYPGAIVCTQNGTKGIIRQLLTPSKVLFRNVVTGEDQSTDIADLTLEHHERNPKRQEISLIDDEAFNIAYEKFVAIQRLLSLPKTTINDIDEVAHASNVSRATVYRWINAFNQGELVTNLLRKPRQDKGTTRLPAEVERLLSQVISEYWLTPQRRTQKNVYRELKRLTRQHGLETPSFGTLVSRLAKLDQQIVAQKRDGPKGLQRFKVSQGTVPNVDGPYSVLQIDHTFLDIMLVDEIHRIAIGRPWITVAIDVYSRMIAGFYISFDPPGTLGTGICIANAILAKDKLLAKYGLEHLSYPCMGKPSIIHVDNAREFKGITLSKACQTYGINLIFRKIKTPNYGAHIERYMGTLATEIHALPGATFGPNEIRENYDVDKSSAMTLNEFERWLTNLIVGAYHYANHSGIKMPPLQRYTEGLLGSDTQLGTGMISLVTDEERLRIDLMPIIERTIQHYGVAIDGIYYYADVLRRWAGAVSTDSKKSKRKFIFRRDPRDISFLLFFDPDAEQYFRIPYRDTNHPPISLWELRATLKHLETLGKKRVDEDLIFRTYDEMRRIEDGAKSLTRKTRLTQERRRKHEAVRKQFVVTAPESTPSKAIENIEDLAILPFDEIERY